MPAGNFRVTSHGLPTPLFPKLSYHDCNFGPVKNCIFRESQRTNHRTRTVTQTGSFQSRFSLNDDSERCTASNPLPGLQDFSQGGGSMTAQWCGASSLALFLRGEKIAKVAGRGRSEKRIRGCATSRARGLQTAYTDMQRRGCRSRTTAYEDMQFGRSGPAGHGSVRPAKRASRVGSW
jgi:hypothetical protein